MIGIIIILFATLHEYYGGKFLPTSIDRLPSETNDRLSRRFVHIWAVQIFEVRKLGLAIRAFCTTCVVGIPVRSQNNKQILVLSSFEMAVSWVETLS